MEEQQPVSARRGGAGLKLRAASKLRPDEAVPAASATAHVSSLDPPSTRIASCTMPSTTAGTSAASVGPSVASALKVGITTEIMEPVYSVCRGIEQFSPLVSAI